MENAKIKSPLSNSTRSTSRRCFIYSSSVELLEISSKNPSLHIVFVPGNPGVISYYSDFIEALYEKLEGEASITAIGHAAQGGNDLHNGRLFSLQEQIDYKVDFIEQELKNCEHPIVLVGHSIGSYICLEIFKRLQNQVKFFIGLYPFLTLNKNSLPQSIIGPVARSSITSGAISYLASFIGSLPNRVSIGIVRRFIGPTWSLNAIHTTCTQLLQYHTMRNVLFMAMTEFRELAEEPDWGFMRKKKDQIAFLFGEDDHWGPLSHLEEISRRVPGIAVSVEREGHTHGYCCTEAGSLWVACHVANILKNNFLTRDV